MKARTLTLGLVALLSTGNLAAQSARIAEWVETAPAEDSSRIALGYPVPVPVDTPVPFDGFRTYAGLHLRHQELATTPFVGAFQVGQTLEGATIWAYRVGDAGDRTVAGTPEPAVLTNGGIHAREWQSPEVVTGIMELLTDHQGDGFLYSFLRDNVNVVLLPVLNIDGFRQTQRHPDRNWLGTDPDDPEFSPRDGRMRRKNMRAVDQDLLTRDDHLNGIDLNRNNEPFWNSGTGRSSADTASLVYHGPAPQSEPETQALETAALLGPAAQLRLYTDVHSFSQVQLWVRNDNTRLALQTESVLRTFANHHAAFPAGKNYGFNGASAVPRNRGIGTTDEFFMHFFAVPSWTLEVEPANSGADYGGFGRNGHDGFILPESQIARVRTELAQSFAVAYYRQAGPPAVAALELIDAVTAATVFEAGWDFASDTTRAAHRFQSQPLELGRDYLAWVAFDKPMRWRTNAGTVAALPGQPGSTLNQSLAFTAGGEGLEADLAAAEWLSAPGRAPFGHRRYRDDAMLVPFRLPRSQANLDRAATGTSGRIELLARDMTALQLDADPSTVARWEDGGWSGYEDHTGQDLTDTGGTDASLSFDLTAESLPDPFVVVPGTSSAWYDPARNGEGFVVEILPAARAVMYWFTYDESGEQDWYIAVGNIRGNRVEFPELLQVAGGRFGPDFDPAQVTESVVGQASFTWAGCDQGVMRWELDHPGEVRRGRMDLQRLTRLAGIECGPAAPLPQPVPAPLSGSWFDPARAGEGFTLEVLADGRALVYWFSFDPQGKRRWFFGIGTSEAGDLVFEDLLTTRGPRFGADFDAAELEEVSWGRLRLELDCAGGSAVFEPDESGFPAGSLQLVRLTSLDGLACE